VEADYPPCVGIALFATKNLFLMEKHVLAFLGGDETIPFTRVEPFDLALLSGKWASLQETGHTLYWDLYIYPSPGQKIMVGIGHRETASASLAYDGLV